MEELYDVSGVPVSFSNSGEFRPKNPLRRPKIHYKNFIIALVVFGIILTALLLAVRQMPDGMAHRRLLQVLTVLIPILLYLFLISRRALIWLIHLYQNKASDARRLACVFEPSCSEYMILAIQKYGTIRGVLKGINRLRRCYPPNFGIDYP